MDDAEQVGGKTVLLGEVLGNAKRPSIDNTIRQLHAAFRKSDDCASLLQISKSADTVLSQVPIVEVATKSTLQLTWDAVSDHINAVAGSNSTSGPALETRPPTH